MPTYLYYLIVPWTDQTQLSWKVQNIIWYWILFLKLCRLKLKLMILVLAKFTIILYCFPHSILMEFNKLSQVLSRFQIYYHISLWGGKNPTLWKQKGVHISTFFFLKIFIKLTYWMLNWNSYNFLTRCMLNP